MAGLGDRKSGEAVAYVTESRLKVMLESDYLAESSSQGQPSASAAVSSVGRTQTADNKDARELSKQIIREVIIPALEKEVNEGKNFAALRQVYNSLILAAWYKQKVVGSFQASPLGFYLDRQKVTGVNIDDPKEAEKIWGRYVEAFKKGAYNYIREEYDPLTQEMLPRKYFAGGLGLVNVKPETDGRLTSEQLRRKDKAMVSMRVDPAQRDNDNKLEEALGTNILTILNHQQVADFLGTKGKVAKAPFSGSSKLVLPSGSTVYVDHPKVLPEQEERWRVWDTSIAKMEQDFKDVLPNQSIVTEVVRLANIRNKQGKKLVYLDWGCGNASALVGLKEKLLQAGVNNVVLVGFADNWTDSWLDLPRDINIIFGTVDQLQDQLNTNKDLFPDGKVDVVGSYYGIQHLHVADLDAYTSHLKFLAQRLGKNGFIVMDSLIGKAATNVYFLTQIFTTVVTGKGSSGTVLPIFLSGPRSTDSAQSRPSGISILGQVVAQVGGKFQLVNVVRFRNKPGRQAIAKAMREQWASGNASSVSSSTTLAKLLATLDQDDAIARSIDFYAAESPDGQLLAVLPVKKARSSNNEDIVAFMHWIAQPGQLEVVRQLLFMVVNQLHEAGGKLVDVDARDVFGFPELNPGATARERQRGAKYSGMQPILQYVKDRTLGELFSALTKDGFINKGDILSLPKGKQVLDRLIKKGIVEDKYDLRVRLNKEWEAQERDIQAIINNVYRSEDEEQRISNLKNLRKVFRRAQQDMVAAESARQVLEQWLQEGFMLQPGESPEVDRIRIQKKLSNGSGRKLSIKGSIERVALRMFQDLLAGKVIVQKADGTYGLAEVLKLSKMSDKDRQQFEAALGRQSNNPAILQGAKQTEVILLKEYLAGSPVVKKGDLNTDLFIELITKGNRTVDQLLKIKILAMAEKPVKPSEQDIIKVVNEVLRDPNLARYLTDVSNVKLPINIIDADIVSKNRVFFERAYEGVFQNSFVSNKSLPKDLDLYAAVERDAKGSIRVLAIDYIKVPEKMTLSMGKQMVFFNESALVSENLAAYKLQDMDSPDKDAALYEASRQILRKLLSSLSVFLTADFRKPGEPFNNSMVKDVLEVLKGAGFIVPEISPTMLDIDRLNGLIASEDFRSQLKEAIYTGHTPNGDVITLPPSLSLEAILGPIEFNPQEFSSLDEIQKIADTIPKGPRFSSQERAVQWLKGPQLFEIYAELARSNKLEATQIDSINKVANMLSKRSRELLNWGYEFQAVEFESSEPLKNVEYLPLDVIEPLLTGLGLPANKFNDITAAVRWLNDSIEPFEKYISRMRVAGGADETISKLLPKNFVDLSTDELRKLAKTNEGRELKRAILTILYPDVTPKILNKRIKLATTWEGTYLKRVLLEVLFKHPMSTSEIIGRASLSRSNARAIILHNFFVTEFTSGELVPDELQKVAVKEKPSGMLREEIARVTATPSDQLPAQISARDWAKVLNNLMNNSGLPEYLQTDRRLFLSEEMLEKMDRAKTGAGRPLSGIELRALNKSLLKKQIFISECFKDKSPRIRNVSAAEERSALEILGLLQEQNTELVLYSGGDHILDKLNVSAPDAKNTSTGGDFAQLSGKKDMSELDDDALREIGKAWKDEALARIFIHDAKKFLFPLSGSVQDALFELDKLTADQEISLEGLNHSITILTSTIELLLAQAHETNDALARGR
ncbi:MAG: hypothetical protein HGA80_03105, partial [Candidatus Omnitrophica bacterium]|nr:hypothetical protein [Candidatus Omnitrophota bacterium]